MSGDVEALKRAAGEAAAAQVESGMVVGLGTGSTARWVVEALGARVASGALSIVGVPTSSQTAAQARQLGIPLATLEEAPALDLAIDGADEIQAGTLHLIKGAGGALLQEKLVEVAAARLIIVADTSKRVAHLGERFALPVEVVRFGWEGTRRRVEALGCAALRRTRPDGTPFVTDEGHYLLDCRFGVIEDPARLGAALKGVVGVVEHGLFLGMAAEAILAGPDGLEVLRPT